MKIAIIGSGISGLSCAWLLGKKYDVTLFEKNNYLGGHTNTASITYHGKKLTVDTGFIVFNFKTYPNLKAFFDLLGVKAIKSKMSFGIKDLDNGLEYSGRNLAGLFAQKKNLFNLKFLQMLRDIVTFNKSATNFIESDVDIKDKTLSQFIDGLRLSKYFKDYYLFPMASAIWSCPLELIKSYPAKTFLQFFYNHGLLTINNHPQWYVVKGGSKEYVKKIIEGFRGKVKLNRDIVRSRKSGEKIILTDGEGENYEFEHVIFACHADQTYKIISDKTKDEEEILSKIKYSKSTAILHKDKSQMPKSKKAWASWTYLTKQKENKASLVYWTNNLQSIDHSKPLFVSLNPIDEINENDIFHKYEYEHPIFDDKAIQAQSNLDTIQGKRKIWFCGAWVKYGFHEDGLNSAINLADKFAVEIPWKN